MVTAVRVGTHAGCVILTVPIFTGDVHRFLTPDDAYQVARELTEHADRLTPGRHR